MKNYILDYRFNHPELTNEQILNHILDCIEEADKEVVAQTIDESEFIELLEKVIKEDNWNPSPTELERMREKVAKSKANIAKGANKTPLGAKVQAISKRTNKSIEKFSPKAKKAIFNIFRKVA